ncbi:MAG: EAL domain-containing protein [Candidatus Acidiferrum sp.]|jgi:diguanylate cyclase (GGDEF)-like protein/PAS domain S-box-containing protein
MKSKNRIDFFPVEGCGSGNLVDLQAAALEATANAVVITDQTGTVIWVNSAFQQLTGYTSAEILGQSTRVFKSGQNSQALYEEMWRTILGGGAWRGELINRRKDGSLYDEEMTITPVHDGGGEITHFIAIKLDISMRRQAEAKHLLLTERLSLATAVAKAGVWELDLASNAFTWDATTFEIYDFQPVVSLPYEKWAAAVYPEDLPVVEAVLRKLIDEKGQGSTEFRIVLADGAVRNVSAVGKVVLDEHANVTRVLGISRDLTESTRIEEALLFKTALLEAQTETTIDGILVVDEADRIVLANKQFGLNFGVPDELLSAGDDVSVRKFVTDKVADPDAFLKTVKYLNSHRDEKSREELRFKNGKTFDRYSAPLVDSTRRYWGRIWYFRDITEQKRMEDRLRRLAAIVESSDDAIIGKALDGTIQTWNGGAERMYEYSAAEVIGKPISILFPHGQPDEISTNLEKVKRDEIVMHFKTVREKKGGKQIQIDLTVSPIYDASGGVVGVSTIARDITERVKSEERLRLWSRVLAQSTEGIFVCDPQERILLANTAFEQLTGFSTGEVLGKTPRILQSGRQDRAFYSNMWKSVLETGAWRGEMWNRRKNGEFYVEWLSISAVYDHKGTVTHYVGIFSDVTVRKQAEERIVHLANYDALTDLPNRVLLMDRLNQLTKAAQRRKSKVAVVFIDLDRFKEVNDSLGHDAGDLLLKTLAKRLSDAVRDEDTVARLGGDEFVVVFQGLHEAQEVTLLAQKLLSCLVLPVTLNGYELTVTASLGISLYPDDAADGQGMIRNADAAMYQAKGAGRNAFHFYTSDLNDRALELLSMENALRRAIERQEFVLHYQPQINIGSGAIVGAEALIRWNHPELGLVMPGKFISIAEERGLIVPIGNWVIEEATRQAGVWQNAGISIPIAVNVSAVQFRQKDFVEQLANSVRKHGITPSRIELELTEGIIMRDAETTIKILERLHEIGFQLSIDDFGTGFSSLNYLRRFPIDKIKIDRSFVSDVTQSESAASIVTAVISLAQSLKLKVIAEGVQTKEQLEILRVQRCDDAQGFLFSPALVSGEFEKLVYDWKPKYRSVY